MKAKGHILRYVCMLLALLIGCKKHTDVKAPEITMPEVTTTAISNVTRTTATGGGNITSDGGASIIKRGVCWSTNHNPDTSLSTKTSAGNGNGIFASNITGLTANATYYLKAYASNGVKMNYGKEVSFKTAAASASITTTVVSSITDTNAVSGGNIISDGGVTIIARGVCWSSTIAAPDTALDTKTNDGVDTGSFISRLTGLKANTIYYVRAYATDTTKNGIGTIYGNVVSFKTAATLATLTTLPAGNITFAFATSGGLIINDGGSPIKNRGICWGIKPKPDIALNTKTSNGVGTGSFISILTGLAPSTIYYIRAYATNDSGTAYGNEVSFTTLAGPKSKLHGIGFSPYIDGQSPKLKTPIDEQQFTDLLQGVSPYIKWIRTYGSDNGLEKAGTLAHNMGLKIAAGAWLERDKAANEVQISNLIAMGKKGQIDIAIVGNEALLPDQGLAVAELIDYIKRVKAELPNIQVTTADIFQNYLSNPDLVSAVDVLYIHVHPYWNGIDIACATNFVDNVYERVKAIAKGKEVVIAETGWPDVGEANSLAVPSVSNAATYFLNFSSWAKAKNVKYFYFSAFDESWKNEPHFVGPHWGIWYKNGGTLKPGMNRFFDGEASPDNWSLDEAAILADPPSISFTFVPPIGSSNELTGIVKGVLPKEVNIAVYIKVNGNWWLKPIRGNPFTFIQCASRFVCKIATGGDDVYATEIRAYVFPVAYTPIEVLGLPAIPADFEKNAVTWTGKER